MYANSRQVKSTQDDVHPELESRVRRHFDCRWQKPVSSHTRLAFEQAQDFIGSRQAPLLLDSGCGTGRSSLRLANAFPRHAVIGIDQSIKRLSVAYRMDKIPDNLLLLRAEAADFWRLLQQHDILIDRHYILYPNPWPKPGHFMRRWHGHPIFPVLCKLSRRLEVRSNWEIYILEMAAALTIARRQPCVTEFVANDGEKPLSDFEAKYIDSGHVLWQLVCDMKKQD